MPDASGIKESGRVQKEPILEIRKVTLRFGGLEALNDLSFALPFHQIVSLIGPNGAGKTTLLNAVSGVVAPSSGEILFRGRSITGLQPFEVNAAGISRTFQHVQLFSNMTVLENVMVGMHSRTRSGLLGGALHLPHERREEKKVREKAESLLDRFRLGARANEPATHLSIAEQKRLEILRAMASDPEILLLDEPAAGLNIKETEAFGDLVLELKRTGQTILLVEHNMHLVMGISDGVVVLHHGAKIGEGRPEEIQRDRRVLEAYLGT